MHYFSAGYASVRTAVIAVFTAVLFASPALAIDLLSAPATPAEIDSLNALVEQIFGDIPEPAHKVDPALVSKVQQKGRVPVIVRLRDGDLPYGFFVDQAAARPAVIGGLQDEVVDDVLGRTSGDRADLHVKRFQLIPAMGLQVDAAGLEALLENPAVIDIIEDVPVPPVLDDSVPLIGADPDGSFSGFTGDGWAVAVIDTGVDKAHSFLSGKVVSEACYSKNNTEYGSTSVCPGGAEQSTVSGSGTYCDLAVYGCDHGTHVAGISAGSGASFAGVAKDADIIAIQVFSRFDDVLMCLPLPAPCALSWNTDQVLGLERVYALRGAFQIASVNMSLGGGSYSAYCNSEIHKPVIDSLRAAGIATVISSGNAGETGAISSPACIETAVSVGSTTKSDVVASYSNSASFLSLLAPGSSIYSSVPGGSYSTKDGTSMAAPHVAGAWAVLKEAAPDASVPEILSALQDTGVPITDTRAGAGNRVKPRINVGAAMGEFFECMGDEDCTPEEPFCVDNRCVECIDETDCDDDGQFCTGDPRCAGGSCGFTGNPCSGGTPVCDEDTDTCVECLDSGDCDDGLYCTGVETCVDNACVDGEEPCGSDPERPYCYEEGESCEECVLDEHCISGYRCYRNTCSPRGSLVVEKSMVKAGRTRGTDSLKFSGYLSASLHDMNSAMGGDITVIISAPYIPDTGEITFTFPIEQEYFKKGKYRSPKNVPAGPFGSRASLMIDVLKNDIKFSLTNADLSGVACPITFWLQFGDYAAERVMDESIVNGFTKPCPLPLVMGLMDSLDVVKMKARKGASFSTDSVAMSGTFTVDGTINPAQPVVITLGPDTFTVPGAQFALKNGKYSCKSAPSGNGVVTATFDTVKCTFSLSIKNATISGSGSVAFGIDVFGNPLSASGTVTLPPGF